MSVPLGLTSRGLNVADQGSGQSYQMQPQTPPVHCRFCPAGQDGQTRLHPLQLFGSLKMLVSQPSASSLLQLLKPALQMKPQTAEKQVVVALAGGVGQSAVVQQPEMQLPPHSW